jgi:polysaccharide biosynthesis/export protein
MKVRFLYYLFTPMLILFTGCLNTKSFVYFNDAQKLNAVDTSQNLHALQLQPGDILQVTISTIDKDISMLFNPNTINNSSTSLNNQIAQGYLVDEEGNIELPIIGKVMAKGKTTSQVNESLKTELSKTLKNVFVATRLVNFKVSVLGDVARPGSYNVPNERITILEALSLAGDLNITAIRDDVMLIREVNGKKEYVSLDLNNSKTLSSPYYYLANNDVLYVKPGANKVFANTRGFQLLPTVLGALSLITVILTNVIK